MARGHSAPPSGAELEELAERHPEEREELLLEAASEWGRAGEHDRAIAVYGRLLAEGCDSPQLVEAYRIGELWEAGRVGEAKAAAARLRAAHPKDFGAWYFVGEMFETGEELRTAAEWYTAGITHALGPATPLTTETIEAAPDAHDLEMLIIGRHRVRRLLEQPHDETDDLADEVHEDRAGALLGALPLDELHDPERLRAQADGDPEVLRETLERLSTSFPAQRVQQASHALYWSEREFAELLRRWPTVGGGLGTSHTEHAHDVERTLRGLSESGEPRVAVVHGTATDYAAFAEADGRPPEADATVDAYAAHLAATGNTQQWPPARNGPCWCGSDRKYKKCCGSPAVA